MATKKKNERPKLIAEQGYWFRFDSYELLWKGSTAYIRPKAGATLRLYRPMEKQPEILQDYLELGAAVHLGLPCDSGGDWAQKFRDRDRRNADRILAFTLQYGLPGIFWQSRPREDLNQGEDIRQPKIFVPSTRTALSLETPYTSYTGYISAREFLGVFLADRFPFTQAIRYHESFLKAYAEPVNAVCEAATDFLRVARMWERFKDGKYSGEDLYVHDDGTATAVAWKSMLSDLNVSDIQLRLHVNGMTQLDYGFPSLIAAMRIMLVLNAVSGSVRICALPECPRAFVARNERARYCSDGHSNVHRQRAFEKRKKAGLRPKR